MEEEPDQVRLGTVGGAAAKPVWSGVQLPFEEDDLASPLAESSRPSTGDDGVIRYANGEPVSKRTLQNRKAQREFRQRRANYLKDLEEKVRRYESGHNETTQALQREVIQLREENEYLRSQLARLHAEPNLIPMMGPMPAAAPRLAYPSQPSRTLPAMAAYAGQPYPYYPAPPNSAGHLPLAPPPPTAHPPPDHRPRSPMDPRARSPFGAVDVGHGATSPAHRGRQVSAPNLMGGAPDQWTNEGGPLRPLHVPDPLSPIPLAPLSAASLRSSTGSPGPTSPHWYPAPPSAGAALPKPWLQHHPPEGFPGHPAIHSPPSLHPPNLAPGQPPL